MENTNGFFGTPVAGSKVGAVIVAERLVARAAYEAALGKSDTFLQERGLSRDDVVEDLTKLYAVYGVAQGPHLTEQLVRDSEAQAAAQATGHGR